MSTFTRRHFIASTTAALATAPWSALAEAVSLRQRHEAAGQVPVKIFATNWGMDTTWDEFCRRAKTDGYDGFEAWIPLDAPTRTEVLKAADKHGLQIGFLCGSWSADFATHKAEYEKALRLAAAQRPVYINTHAGRDYFTFEQNLEILKIGLQVMAETGINVCCETHRGRCAYNAPVTQQYLEALPELRLTADLSHWCCVHESLLEHFDNTVALALERSHHVHARVGHAQGPQVNDPRAPEWETALRTHLVWWDQVMSTAAKEQRPVQTFLCEFGPPDYLPALPYTRQPVANQWDINRYMQQLLRKRYT
jgi:sugar phosphate isomerase/epimerase